MAGFVNAKNKVPEYQRYYQAASRQHTPLWRIHPRSKYYVTPYIILVWGTFGASMYAVGRKILGYNSFFGDK